MLAALGCTGDHRCCAIDEHHTLDCPYYNVRRSNRHVPRGDPDRRRHARSSVGPPWAFPDFNTICAGHGYLDFSTYKVAQSPLGDDRICRCEDWAEEPGLAPLGVLHDSLSNPSKLDVRGL